jgi:uncharacterized metal-binding protein YceD (DUF177 family)
MRVKRITKFRAVPPNFIYLPTVMNEAKNDLAPFVLAFAGLKEGIHHFSLSITSKFFDAFDYTEFNDVSLNANIVLNKKATILEIQFSVSGTVTVNCDVSNETFDLPINPRHELIVKFGEEFNDENEELLVLPHGSHQVDIAQTLFETVVLAVPQKRVHPGIENGSLHSDMLERLEKLHPNESTKAPETTDPRWDALKKLKKD